MLNKIITTLSRFIRRLKNPVYTALALLLLGFLGSLLISNAPEIKRLDYVQIKPSKTGVTIGWQELGQFGGTNSSEKEHLRISNNDKQGWLLQNVSADRRVDARTDKTETRYLRRYALQADDVLHFNTFKIQVKQADGTKLVLHNVGSKETALWTGTELLINKKSGYTACEHDGFLRRVIGQISDKVDWFIRDSFPQKSLQLFSFGGQVHCTGRWKQTELAPDSIRFYWHKGKFWIGPGSDPARVIIEHDHIKQDLKSNKIPVDAGVDSDDGKVNRLILGRTYYQLATNSDLMTLKPVLNQQIFFSSKTKENQTEDEKEAALKKADEEEKLQREMKSRGIEPVYKIHTWIGESLIAEPFRPLSLLILLSLIIFSVVFSSLVSWAYRQLTGERRFIPTLTSSIITLCFSWLAVAWKGDLSVALSLLWLTTLWASFILLIKGRLYGLAGRIWILAILLAGFGALTLSQLAAGADSTRWLRYATENIFWLSQMSVAITLIALIPMEALNGLWILLVRNRSKTMKLIKTVIVLAVVFLLLAQFAIGTEQGIWSIQPVEVAKLLIIFIASHALWHLLELRSINSSYYRHNPIARIMLFVWVLMAFIVVSLLIAVGVHDYSPTLIVMALMAAYLWRAIPHPIRRKNQQMIVNWVLRSVFVLLPLIAVMGVGFWFFGHPPDYDSQIPQAERLRIWANPELFPEAAAQLLNSLARIGHGGWLGSGWFGSNGLSMQVPAIQDDFIAAFLLNRFGGLMGLLLVFIQLLWIATLFKLSTLLTRQQSNHDLHAAHSILGNVLFGLAWIHLLHWLISWSNVLGLLPIMGQPMTWLSAGNSHLLAIGAVTLVLGMLGSWISNEVDKA